MDQPRPRHQADRPPLIIERPDLVHPLRRLSERVLTTLAWLFWLAMWIPFISAVARHFGYPFPAIIFPNPVSLASLFDLLEVMPYAIGLALMLVMASYLREKIKTRIGRTDERWRPVGMARLATGAALDPAHLAAWQEAQVLYVEHGPLGRVTNASMTQPSRPD